MKLRYLLPALLLSALPITSHAGVDFSIAIAPPPLPVYEQPPCPTDGYLWNPGYYAYDETGYYFVPGVWVAPPTVGVLWTPGYWGYSNGFYGFNEGYWGPTVGFYGGINYGFGYGGDGYYGGRWDGGAFRYNTAITRVNESVIHNTYVDKSVVRNVTNNRASFNGPGGTNAKATAAQEAAAREKHAEPTAEQLSHRKEAASKPESRVAAGKAGEAAARKPGEAAAGKPGEAAAGKPGAPATAAATTAKGTSRKARAAQRSATAAAARKTAAAPQADAHQPRAVAPAAHERATHEATHAPAAARQHAPAPRAEARPRAAAPQHAAAAGHGDEKKKGDH